MSLEGGLTKKWLLTFCLIAGVVLAAEKKEFSNLFVPTRESGKNSQQRSEGVLVQKVALCRSDDTRETRLSSPVPVRWSPGTLRASGPQQASSAPRDVSSAARRSR